MKVFIRLPVYALTSLFIIAALFSWNSAQAAEATIVVLDMQKALSNSASGKAAQQVMESKVKELQEKFIQEEDELLAMQGEIEKMSSVWSEEKKQDKAIEFQRKRRDLRVKQDDANLELKKLQEQQLSPILQEMEKLVAKIAKEKGYKIILPKAAVVYTDEAMDITEEVTKALNGTSK
ncbi:MAG: OmpH family outer membrane protein [Desulfobulbaceae bacterium]|nr:OmpH family outer membrane protein [Desulfobulbaceae bacterium]